MAPSRYSIPTKQSRCWKARVPQSGAEGIRELLKNVTETRPRHQERPEGSSTRRRDRTCQAIGLTHQRGRGPLVAHAGSTARAHRRPPPIPEMSELPAHCRPPATALLVRSGKAGAKSRGWVALAAGHYSHSKLHAGRNHSNRARPVSWSILARHRAGGESYRVTETAAQALFISLRIIVQMGVRGMDSQVRECIRSGFRFSAHVMR